MVPPPQTYISHSLFSCQSDALVYHPTTNKRIRKPIIKKKMIPSPSPLLPPVWCSTVEDQHKRYGGGIAFEVSVYVVYI
jgi:hypothetical protein